MLNEEVVKNELVELYSWYFLQARKHVKENEEALRFVNADDYKAGKLAGAVEALEAVMLQLIGGKELYKIWETLVQMTEVQNGGNQE